MARWTAGALVAIVPLAIALPALAQRGGAQPSPDVNHAKEMVTLIEGGQLSLADATKVAEKHAKGTALSASCQILMNEGQPAAGGNPGGSSADQAGAAGKRLVYSVSCYAGERVQVVQVDGLSKKVIEGAPARAEPEKPQPKTP
ncbi:MAG: hypothetical protein HRF50_00490 [Phycisphaerae bacterium]